MDISNDSVSIPQALTVAKWLWPEFEVMNGAIILAQDRDDEYQQVVLDRLARAHHILEFEAFESHTHLFDCFEHEAGLDDGNDTGVFWDITHPDFRIACELGKLMARSWAAKLKVDFPNYRFRVYYTQNDNPIVRFHRVREESDFWLDPEDWQEQIRAGEIMILDTKDLFG